MYAGAIFNGATFSVARSYGGTLTKVSTGVYQFTFTTPLPDTNYWAQVQDNDTTNQLGHSQIGSITTTGFRILHYENQVATDTGPGSNVVVFY